MNDSKQSLDSSSQEGNVIKEIRYSKKLVIVGDEFTGKTSLLTSCKKSQFSYKYTPTVFDCQAKLFRYENKIVEMRFWDTSGKDDYTRLRPLSYPNSHVILLCYSVDSRESLFNAIDKWSTEVFHYCKKNAAILLVGCKADLRNDPDTIARLQKEETVPISKEEGIEAAELIGAVKYVETSSLTGYGIKELFEEAVKMTMTDPVALKKKKKRSCRCVIV